MTALKSDTKHKGTRVKAASHISITKTQMLIWCNNFISILEIKKINLDFGQVLQLQANQREFCLLCTVKCTIYMLKINKQKNSTWLQKKNGRQLLFLMKNYTIYKWKHQQKHYTDHSLVFRQAGKKKKKKKNQETLFLTTRSKPQTSRLKKKERNKEILLKEQ